MEIILSLSVCMIGVSVWLDQRAKRTMWKHQQEVNDLVFKQLEIQQRRIMELERMMRLLKK